MYLTIKKAREAYRKFGSNTRLVIRIIFIFIILLAVLSIYCETAVNHPHYYTLISISEDALNTIKSISGIGFLSIVITGFAEEHTEKNL